MKTFSAPARLVADPEMSDAGGTPVPSLRLAIDTGFGKNKSSMLVGASKFGAGTDALAGMLRKGSFVVVAGELSQREYQKDGVTRQALELRIDRLDLGPKIDAAPPATPSSHGAARTDDEIPFNTGVPWAGHRHPAVQTNVTAFCSPIFLSGRK